MGFITIAWDLGERRERLRFVLSQCIDREGRNDARVGMELSIGNNKGKKGLESQRDKVRKLWKVKVLSYVLETSSKAQTETGTTVLQYSSHVSFVNSDHIMTSKGLMLNSLTA